MSKHGFWSRSAWAPLAAIAFTFAPQRSVEFRVVDGPNEQCFGAPLIWQCDGVSSLEFVWFSGPLALDLAAYSIAALGVVWLSQRLPIRMHPFARTSVVLALWVVGVASFALNLFGFLELGFHRGVWPDPIPMEDIVRRGWSALFRF